MKIGKKLAALATVGAFMASAVPVLATEGGLVISGNGFDSTNMIKMSSSCTTVVNQQNQIQVGTSVNVSQNTGGNSVSGNTGGDNSITTGDNSLDVTVAVSGSSNDASVPSCCCETGTVEAVIEDNGAKSYNKIWDTSSNTLVTNQQNQTKVKTRVSARQNTGKNKAKWNTNGSNSIGTGDNSATVTVGVEGGLNTL